MPVIKKQHSRVGCECHARIKNLRRKLPHSFHAVVHIKDRFCHNRALALFPQAGPALAHQASIEHFLHPLVDIVRKTPHIKTLDIPRDLHNRNRRHISCHKDCHIRKLPKAI